MPLYNARISGRVFLPSLRSTHLAQSISSHGFQLCRTGLNSPRNLIAESDPLNREPYNLFVGISHTTVEEFIFYKYSRQSAYTSTRFSRAVILFSPRLKKLLT